MTVLGSKKITTINDLYQKLMMPKLAPSSYKFEHHISLEVTPQISFRKSPKTTDLSLNEIRCATIGHKDLRDVREEGVPLRLCKDPLSRTFSITCLLWWVRNPKLSLKVTVGIKQFGDYNMEFKQFSDHKTELATLQNVETPSHPSSWMVSANCAELFK